MMKKLTNILLILQALKLKLNKGVNMLDKICNYFFIVSMLYLIGFLIMELIK